MSNSKVAFVTGATRGIGKQVALTLGQNGHTVVGTSTSDAGANSISAFLKEHNINGCGLRMDVCDMDSITVAYASIKEQFGSPLIVVNNAGITQDNIFLRMKQEQWDQVIDTNLTSFYRVTKICLRAMVKAKWGRVVSISSVVGASGNPGQANYCASKAGIVGATKSLAIEMAKYAITFNAVAPGFIRTDMTDKLSPEHKEALLLSIPSGAMGEAVDIANAVNFLTSDAAGYITGQTLHVNGGMYLG